MRMPKTPWPSMNCLVLLLALSLLYGCGAASKGSLPSAPSSPNPSAGAASLSISPQETALQAGNSLQFTAASYGLPSADLEWLVNGIEGGNSASGTITRSGLYTAPQAVTSNTVIAVAVISKTDPTKASSAAVTVVPGPVPITVSVAPGAASLYPSQAQQFTATVKGTTNQAVSWFVNGNEGGDSSVGTISSTGTYTAPLSAPAVPSITIAARSTYDTAASATASVTVMASAAPPITAPANNTYYVDASAGNDSNDGRSPTTAWRTIAKVNVSSFSPGDSILFKSGDTWREQLNIMNSGSTGNPIIFGSYGSGNAPVISAADLAIGWAGTLAPASNVTLWSVNGASSTNQVFEDGRRLAPSAASSTMTVGSFYYDSGDGKVYVRTFSDDNPNTHTMEISNRNYAIYEAGGSQYITVQNLQTSGANRADVYFNGSSFIAISNVLAENSFGDGIRFDVVASSSIVSSTAARNGSNGISADDAPGLVINGCVAYDNASLANVNYTAGIKINPDYPPYPPSTNVTIENSEAYGNGPGQAASGEWLGVGIWADTIQGGLLIQRNLVYDNNLMGIYLDADNHATAAYNVVYGNGHSGAVDGGGIAVYGDGRTITANSVFGNTVYGNLRGGIKVSGANLANGCENTAVENNIAMGTVSGPNFAATGGCENSGRDGTGNVYAYNAFGMPSPNFIEYGAGKYFSAYADFDAAYGTSTHSVTTDPLLTSASTNDFTLTSSSPAIDAGTNLGDVYQNALDPASTWPSHVVTANQNYDGSKWAVGAYAQPHP